MSGLAGVAVGTAAVVALLAFASQIALAQKKPAHPKPPDVPPSQLVEKQFARWDRDHNDALDLSEIDRLIEDHSVRGRQAALVVCIRQHMTKKGNQPTLSHEELLKRAREHDFMKSVEQTARSLETIDRELFLPTDPDLATFQQGRLGDCYLLAAIAAQVHRSPKAVREMIHPEVTGGFLVVFGDGRKIEVPPLTDSELLLGARLDKRHGSWLAVLEKAYGIIRRRERDRKGDKARGIVPVENMGSGHSSAIISLLTGRQAKSLRLDRSSLEQIHKLLTETTKRRRLVCADTGRDRGIPGITQIHSHAVLGYDATKREVRLFNPHGNNFSPKGRPGIVHGYATKNGAFTVPLEEFPKVFNAIGYETGQPTPHAGQKKI